MIVVVVEIRNLKLPKGCLCKMPASAVRQDRLSTPVLGRDTGRYQITWLSQQFPSVGSGC